MFSPMRYPSHRWPARTPAVPASRRIFGWPGQENGGSLYLEPSPSAEERSQEISPPTQPSENSMSYLRHISCVAILVCSGFAVGGQQVDRHAGQGAGASASSMPLVRLRKLHLVRPDLIPYPISFEVYC